MTALGDRIRTARQAARLSQTALADAVGATQQQVSHWESGRKEPSLYYAARLARALGVTLDELAGVETSHPSMDREAPPE